MPRAITQNGSYPADLANHASILRDLQSDKYYGVGQKPQHVQLSSPPHQSALQPPAALETECRTPCTPLSLKSATVRSHSFLQSSAKHHSDSSLQPQNLSPAHPRSVALLSAALTQTNPSCSPVKYRHQKISTTSSWTCYVFILPPQRASPLRCKWSQKPLYTLDKPPILEWQQFHSRRLPLPECQSFRICRFQYLHHP